MIVTNCLKVKRKIQAGVCVAKNLIQVVIGLCSFFPSFLYSLNKLFTFNPFPLFLLSAMSFPVPWALLAPCNAKHIAPGRLRPLLLQPLSMTPLESFILRLFCLQAILPIWIKRNWNLPPSSARRAFWPESCLIFKDAPIFTLNLRKRFSLRVLNVLLSDLAKKELRHIGNQDPITEAH